MRKKRITALLTALAVMASAFMAGCGTGEDTKQPQNSEQQVSVSEMTEGSTEQEEELEPVTLKYWMMASKSEDSDLVLEAVNEYLAEVLPNTTLEIEWIESSEWKDKWAKAMASGEKIDLSWLGWMNAVETEVSMGSLMPIDDLLAEYGAGIVESLGDTVVEKHRSLDGNLYFLPAWQGMVGNRMGLYLPHENVELAGEGWAEDFQNALYATWKEPYWEVEKKKEVVSYVEQYLEASKEAGKLGLGFSPRYNLVQLIFDSNTKTVGTWVNVVQEGDTYYLEGRYSTDGGNYYAVEIMHDWYEKGYIREDIASVGNENKQWTADVPMDQSYLNYIGNGWLDDENDNYTQNAGFQIDGFYLQEVCELSNGFATGTVIPATSQNPERAMMLINLIYTDPTLYQMLVYGIEDTHYTTNTDGTITIPENVTYQGPSNWELGTCMNSLQTNATKLDYYQRLKDAEAVANESILEGFTFDTAPVSVEISNMAAIEGEYGFAFTKDNWDELMVECRDKMIAAGIETLVNEVYDQLLPYAEAKGMKVEILEY